MKINSYIITIILVFSLLNSASTSVPKMGPVEIEDLFYNSKPTLSPSEIKNPKLNQIDKILVENEDLELESLEIADIDLATFGEYEAFLNKYYNDNFIDINSRVVREFKLNFLTSFGSRIPVGANAKITFYSGLDFGLTLVSNSTFKIFNKKSKLYGNLNITQIVPISKHYSKYQITRLTGGITSYINKNIFINSGLSITSSKGGSIGDSNNSLGSSINFDLGYKFNIIKQINIGLYLRGQSMILGTTDPPIDGGGSLETLSIGMIFDSPVYLIY